MSTDYADMLEVTIRKRRSSIVDAAAEGDFSLDVGFSAAPGITMLFGPSGAGKTTLLDCLAGLLSPDEGRIALNGDAWFDSASRTNLPPARRGAGYVFQDLGLFPHLTVEQNVEYGIFRLPPLERRRRSAAILEALRIPSRARSYPAALSGGERQRVALARSLVVEPRLLLLDEPLSALDASIKARIIDDLREWNRSHDIPVLYVTHSHAEAFALGERMIVLEGGKILAEGPPQEVLLAPRHETVAQLAGFENVFDAEVIAIDEKAGVMTCRLDTGQICVEAPLGRTAPAGKVRLGLRAGDILLAAEPPRSLSARNVFSATILSLARHDYQMEALVDCGVLFRVHLTLGAAASLKLAAGSAVWVVFKTHSCALLQPTSSANRNPGF